MNTSTFITFLLVIGSVVGLPLYGYCKALGL